MFEKRAGQVFTFFETICISVCYQDLPQGFYQVFNLIGFWMSKVFKENT